jgi:hypothetical protein
MPWNQRKALLTHHRWFRNLVDFHHMTRGWVEEATSEREAHQMERAPSPEMIDDIKLLDALPDARLDTLLDDTDPTDLLARLEYSVWAVQAWTYTSLTGRISGSEKEKLNSVLEQSVWKQGRAAAEKRWHHAEKQTRGNFSEDLRSLFLTLIDSPVALNLGEDAFLLRRGLIRELEFEFRACPHHSRYPEVIPVANELCFFHSAWVRGYIYGLNHQVQIEYHPVTLKSGGCSQHWKL